MSMGDDLKREDDGNGGSYNSLSVGEMESRTPRTAPRRTSGPIRISTKGNWTPEEDAVLAEAVKKYNGKNWKCVAKLLKERTDVQCLHRWQKVVNPELIKGAWTKKEDSIIIKQVEMHGSKNWSTIAKFLPGRMGKQCRERWVNHLNPAIKKDVWSKEEEMVLISAHNTYGNKWAEISKFLPGRSDNSIKNHWNCSLKKRCGQDMPIPAFQISSFDWNNYGSEAKRRKFDPNEQSNIFLDQDASLERQDESELSKEPSTPLNSKDEKYFPLWRRQFQVKDATIPVSSESLSRPEDYCQQACYPILFSTPPDLSLSLSSTTNSQVSILRRSAKSFDAPSIVKRRNQSKRAVDMNVSGDVHDSSERVKHAGSVLENNSSQQGAGNKGVSHVNDIWTTKEFSHLPGDYLQLGRKLDAEFDKEWGSRDKEWGSRQ